MLKDVLIFVVVLVLAILIGIAFRTQGVLAKRNALPISLQDAYQIGQTAALEWNSSSRLYEMLSSDQGEDATIAEAERGALGKRRSWNLDFVIPASEKHLIVEIQDGKVTHETEVVGPQSDDLMDESEVLAVNIQRNLKSVRDQQLMPGRGWATGYHFRIYKEGDVLVLLIRGMDSNGNPAVSAVDAKNDKTIFKERKLPSGEWRAE